jgi:HEPN domain-containing protein
MKTPRDHAESLLFKASHDLIAARAILAAGDALDTVCFHAQQTVEKSLKAVLALHEIEYPRRHDVGELLELVRPLVPEVAQYAEHIINLAPYAVEIRYEVEFEPSDDQAVEAVQTAAEVYELIKRVVEKK